MPNRVVYIWHIEQGFCVCYNNCPCGCINFILQSGSPEWDVYTFSIYIVIGRKSKCDAGAVTIRIFKVSFMQLICDIVLKSSEFEFDVCNKITMFVFDIILNTFEEGMISRDTV